MIRKNLLSSLIAITILILSLVGQGTFSKFDIPRIPHIDKIVHLLMYCTLTAALIYENRKELKGLKSYLVLSVFPLLFGATIEIMQRMFTSDRTGDVFDLLFNISGIVLAVSLWLLIKKIGFFRS